MRKKKKIAWDNLQILEKLLRDLRERNLIPPEEAERYNMILAGTLRLPLQRKDLGQVILLLMTLQEVPALRGSLSLLAAFQGASP